MGEIIHQNTINSEYCPVKAAARRIHHILKHDGTPQSLICGMWEDKNTHWTSITSTDMIKTIR